MIAVLDYGIGNLRSAQKALVHLGAEVRVVTSPKEALGANGVVLPGVGSFGACARALRATALDRVARDAIAARVPFLGICVGFQLLFDASDESPEEEGLGVFSGTVARLPENERLPQMQWNTVQVTSPSSVMFPAPMVDPWLYFVHSYAPVPEESSQRFVVGTCEYGATIAVAMEDESTWGVQFHPEKSGTAGLALLSRFVGLVGESARVVEES